MAWFTLQKQFYKSRQHQRFLCFTIFFMPSLLILLLLSFLTRSFRHLFMQGLALLSSAVVLTAGDINMADETMALDPKYRNSSPFRDILVNNSLRESERRINWSGLQYCPKNVVVRYTPGTFLQMSPVPVPKEVIEILIKYALINCVNVT